MTNTEHRRLAAIMLTDMVGYSALASLMLLLLLCVSCSTPTPRTDAEPKLLVLSGDLSVHDPCIIKERDTYYIFCTGGGRRGGIIPARCSTNLLDWKRCGSALESLPDWATNEITRARSLDAGHLLVQREVSPLLFALQFRRE